MLLIHKNPGLGIRNQPPWSHQFPETTGAALLKCSLGRCWAWRYPNTFPQWAPMRCSFPKKKRHIKHLTRLTKSQLHSTFDPGRPDIGWWPWPKHQRQASHFPNPWRFIIWEMKVLSSKAVAMVDPVFPCWFMFTAPWSTRLLPLWLACVKMIEHHKHIADTKIKIVSNL